MAKLFLFYFSLATAVALGMASGALLWLLCLTQTMSRP